MKFHYEEYKSRDEAIEREKMLKTGFGRRWLKSEMLKGNLQPWDKNMARQAGNLPYERKTYYLVREIISPERLILSNGLRTNLLGVKERRERMGVIIYRKIDDGMEVDYGEIL